MFQQLLVNGLIAGSVYALVALGFTVIYKTVRFFHIAHGVVYAAGAYLAYSVINSWHSAAGWVVGVLVGLIGAGLLGLLIDRSVYLPLRKKKSPDLVFLIASFGVFILIQNLIQIIWGAQIVTLRTGPVEIGHQFFGAVITTNQIIIILTAVILSLALWYLFQRTKMGKAIRAVADDPIGASVVGIYPERIILYAFAIGSVLAGIAGILISLETNLDPTMGFSAILNGIIASIVGGIGSLPGALLGGLFIGLAENFGIWFLPTQWKDTIAFVILIIFLLLKPSGILGEKTEKNRV